jgi:hypothetical protein
LNGEKEEVVFTGEIFFFRSIKIPITPGSAFDIAPCLIYSLLDNAMLLPFLRICHHLKSIATSISTTTSPATAVADAKLFPFPESIHCWPPSAFTFSFFFFLFWLFVRVLPDWVYLIFSRSLGWRSTTVTQSEGELPRAIVTKQIIIFCFCFWIGWNISTGGCWFARHRKSKGRPPLIDECVDTRTAAAAAQHLFLYQT